MKRMECAAEVAEKEGSKLLGRQDYAKQVALDLYRFMEARTSPAARAARLFELITRCRSLFFQLSMTFSVASCYVLQGRAQRQCRVVGEAIE